MSTAWIETSHPDHPHHLECPRCGRHTVVTKAEGYYVCLSCGWERDLTNEWGYGVIRLFSAAGVILLFLLLL